MPSRNVERRLELPQGTREKLDAFRRRVWTVKVMEGLGAGLFGLLLSYLVVFVLDRIVETPLWLRSALLISGTLGLGIFFPLKCHRWVWRTRHFDQLARLLKHRMPRLSDRMLGIIELAQSDLEQQRSSVLCEAALRQVDEEIREQSFHDAVPHPRHRMWGWMVAGPALVVVLVLLFVPAAGRNALMRWLMPWKTTERYTFAQLEDLPGELVVPFAEEFNLTATLADGTAWSPKSAVARIGEQPTVSADLTQQTYQFVIPPQNQNGDLNISAGDARRSVHVEPKPRPEITELVAKVKLPDYLQYSSQLTKDARGGTLTVLQGSETQLVAQASRELRAATLNGQPQPVKERGVTTESTLIEDTSTLRLSWTDVHGLQAKEPFELSVQVDEDMAPSIVCSELARQQVVLVDQVLSFQVTADDDYGLKHIGMEWRGVEDPLHNPQPSTGETLIAAGGPENNELGVRATFCAAREQVSPQTLELRLFAKDYHPERERVYSPPYTLFVLSAEDHANWLTEQMRRWSRQAQEVYERENQLFEANKELRRLTAGELDSPTNRRRLETQASAEAANARQLSAVSNAGKQLIKEAAKNNQFNVMTMEGLAEMVNTLDEMAAKRMPSIADLLKQAAAAPSSKEQSKDGDGSDGSSEDAESPPQVGNNRDAQTAEGQSQEDDAQGEKKKPTPAISDVESSMNKPTPEEEGDEEQHKKGSPSGGGKFGLPTTTVLGGGKPQPKSEDEEKSAEEVLDEAIEEQEDLLDAFSKVAEELQRILDNLEGSTFVKRFKAASRRHSRLANDLNDSLAATFGRRVSQLTDEQKLACSQHSETELLESQNLMTIRQDLEAYYNRVQEGKFRTVIGEINELNAVAKLETLSHLISDNLHGQSIAHAEYWADTLDRWAEQLVGPG